MVQIFSTLSNPLQNITVELEHKSNVYRKEKRSPLNLHIVEKHNEGNPGFRVTGVFGGNAAKSQVRETVVHKPPRIYEKTQ